MIPLHSHESEQSVIGAMLIDPRRLDDVLDVISSSDFYDPSHRTIFGAIEAVHLNKIPVDVVTVGEQLETRGELEAAGGYGYMADLAKNIPSAANVMRYVKIVNERSLRRRLVNLGEQLTVSATEVEDVEELIESSIKAIEQAQPECSDDDLATGSDLCAEALQFVTERFENKGSIGGVPTGFIDVDKRLLGMKPGDLIIVAGRPGMGKTVYGLNIANHVADHSGPVLFVSLEMSKLQLGLRQQANFGGISMTALQEGNLDAEDFNFRLPNAVRRATESRLYCDFRSGQTAAQIRAKAKAVKRKHGLSMIVIDYLGKMTAPRAENRTNEVRMIVSALKDMAKDLQVPVMALAQLNRGVEQRPDKRPMMSDLRDSGDIEQEADVIQFLYRDEYYDHDSPHRGYVEVITAKQRMGEPGTDFLVFQGQYSRMSNADMQEVHRMDAIASSKKEYSGKKSRGFEA